MALTKVDSDYGLSLSQAHPETMDFLSRAWCDFAIQAFQHEPTQEEESLVLQLQDNSVKMFENDSKAPSMKMDKSAKVDDGGDRFVPPWKANDLKSWIWMQQAMHPEVNYNSYFRKKWIPWKITPFKSGSIKKWLKEMRHKRKEEQRLQRAEVHAALSVAGLAAALAAVAAESNNNKNTTKDSAVASAAALVAAQCAKVAEAMGADRAQLKSVIGSAVHGTSRSEIVTLTAAAATSMRGADTLKARSGCTNRPNGSSQLLAFEDNNEIDFNFEKCRSTLALGTNLNVQTTDGRYIHMSVKVMLDNEGKVILKLKKLNIINAFARHNESVVFDMHVELYKYPEAGEAGTGYLIVLTTDKGIVKLDMINDYALYITWSKTINHILMMLSTSVIKHDFQLCKT